MTHIHYLKGDATAPQSEGNKIIVHICNDIGGWGKGFVMAISKRWSAPEKAYREWYQHRAENDFRLGSIQLIAVESEIYVANMIAQHGIRRKANQVPIRYEAVEACLGKVAIEAASLNASVHMPRIGCGLAGGKWEMIEPLIAQTLLNQNIPTFVYDFN